MLAILSKTTLEFYLELDLQDLDDWTSAVIDARATLYPATKEGK